MTSNLDARLSTYSSVVLSIFRVVIGFLFAVHGSSGLFGWPLAMQFPVGNWPFWWAALIEFVTGLLVLFGLFTRPAAFIASGTMAVAYFWQHQPHALWPIDPASGGEPAVLYCFAFFLLVFMGPGWYSVDARRRPPGTVGGTLPRRRFGGSRRRPVTETAEPERRGGLLDRWRGRGRGRRRRR